MASGGSDKTLGFGVGPDSKSSNTRSQISKSHNQSVVLVDTNVHYHGKKLKLTQTWIDI